MKRIESIQPAVDIAFRLTGIKQEFPELDRQAALMMLGRSWFRVLKHQSILEGNFPTTGADILVGNHHQDRDIDKIVAAVSRTGRLIGRTVVRKSLVDPSPQARESAEYLESIGNKQDEYNKFSPTRAYTLLGIGVIPILRDKPGTTFLHTCDQVINTGQLLGIFMQPTRHEDCLLEGLEPGIGLLAKKYPHTPVIPVAFSGPPDGPDRMTVRPSFTYAQLLKKIGRKITADELTILIADMIAKGLPPRVQENWWQITRTKEIARLKCPRVLTISLA